MAAFLIIQECVVLLVAALLGLLWWSTRETSKRHQAESERCAELVRRMHIAYGRSLDELTAWRGINLYLSYCAVALPTPTDFAAVNGSGTTPRGKQSGPWHQVIDEYAGSLQDLVNGDLFMIPPPHESTWRVDMHSGATSPRHRGGRRAPEPRAHVSAKYDVAAHTLGSAGGRLLVELCGVPPRYDYPRFDDELGELETSGGWFHVPPHPSGNKAAAAVAAAQLREMEGNDRG